MCGDCHAERLLLRTHDGLFDDRMHTLVNGSAYSSIPFEIPSTEPAGDAKGDHHAREHLLKTAP